MPAIVRQTLAIFLACSLVWSPLVSRTVARADDPGASRTVSTGTSVAATRAPTAQTRGDMPAVSTADSRLSEGALHAASSLTAEELEGLIDPELSEAVRQAIAAGEGEEGEGGATEAPAGSETRTPISLPGGETRTAVNPQAISLPSAEGSIEGMGESFSPILSSGTATFGVPIAVAPGRAGVQPSLSLSYSSSGGNGAVGFGWGFGVPFISRQTDRGLPIYDDRAQWHSAEDRFIYNGGQELVPVSNTDIAAVDGGSPTVPSDVASWQQYRARVEGGFMRFFRAPDARRWVVQSPDGSRFDFGAISGGASDLDSTQALEVDNESGGRPSPRGEAAKVFRWMITRSSDAHGSTIYYRYTQDQGQIYLADISYISPLSCAGGASVAARRECTAPVSSYGARVRFVYESRQDAFSTYSSGYPITTAKRLKRVEVTAFDDASSQRTLVRRYHLTYETAPFHSLLSTIQVEGRPSSTTTQNVLGTTLTIAQGNASVSESSLGDAVVGQLLPAMRFRYSSLPTTGTTIAGFGSLSNTVVDVLGSPPNSIDESRSELMDVNSDGLPDLVVADPARYRTREGDPAVGVFFNGFSGSDVTPGQPGQFSAAVPVPMRSDLAGTMTFSNLNIVPMDVDGDGRQDLLHMPRERSYGWFTPVRRADPVGAPNVSPRDQGWRFAYARIDLPAADFDPRIDLGRDGQHIQTVDVNNDHLIDVVRTTGTVMQTWLNLGWLPGGDGRFGSYTISGTSALTTSNVSLSTQPYESCLLQSGTPVDFESPEVRFADMNGDGLQDIVEVQRGRIRYWPGRGVGSWGTGPRICGRADRAVRYIEVASPPRDLPIDLTGVQFADIDGDGASDILAVRFDAMDIWFNRAGQSFTDRLILRGTPASPGFANRVRFLDVDGTGTLDAVYGDGADWRYVDLLRGADGRAQRPRLLVGVENGLGAETTIGYESAAIDYLRDLAEARSCAGACESFAWARTEGSPSARLARLTGESTDNLYRAEGTPVLSTVVRSVRTSDRMDLLGREAQVSESRFAYHDGYYEGIEQEFRGFGAADAVVVGRIRNGYDESTLTRTWFHQGRRPQNIADDRLAWSPDEALKGREYLTEVFDNQGTFLSTSHASLATRLLHNGLDGRPIQYAYVSEMNEFRYDTSPFTPGSDSIALPSVVRQSSTAAVTGTDAPRTIAMRAANRARVRTTYDSVDNLGHVLQQTVYGHVADAGWVGNTDESVVSMSTPQLLNTNGQWLWRTSGQYGYGTSNPSLRFGDTSTTFNAETGDAIASTTTVTNAGAPSYTFGADPSGQGGALALGNAAENIVSSSWFDAWGNSLGACAGANPGGTTVPTSPPAGCFRFGTVSYDTLYGQFPVSERAFTSATASLTTTVQTNGWDRGLGAVRSVKDPNNEVTTITHDGLGRVTSMTPPPVAGCDPAPSTVLSYELTSDGRTQPMSRVQTTTVNRTSGCEFATLGGTEGTTSTAYGYVDGLGRVRATVSQGVAEDNGDGVTVAMSTWIRNGIAVLDPKGQAIRAFHPTYLSAGQENDFAAVVSLPTAAQSTRVELDAFGRTVVSFSERWDVSSMSYHAASTTACDPLDNGLGTIHTGTCTTSRSDGFGRVVDQILTEQIDNLLFYDRLWSYYRADGAVQTLVRTQTTDQNVRPATPPAMSATSIRRDFYYDNVGRRLGSADPDSDNPSDTNPATNTWRYRFNRVGDLVGVRDPRGCGQNFFYDLGGRLLGEQYVACGETQTSATELPISDVPGGSVGESVLASAAMVDVRYEYDAAPTWLPSGTTPPSIGGYLGRATGVTDRGQRSAVAYDRRGLAIWTARQMALIPNRLALTTSAMGANYPTISEATPTSGSVAFDEAHTYVETSEMDHAGRPHRLILPLDPDFGGPAPLVVGEMAFNRMGAMHSSRVMLGGTVQPITTLLQYDEYGAAVYSEQGTALQQYIGYDERRRPSASYASRTPTLGAVAGTLNAIENITADVFTWDAANNLVAIDQNFGVSGVPAPDMAAGHGFIQTRYISHDTLYRVSRVETYYSEDSTTDWRSDALSSNANDPMHPRPAGRVGTLPTTRVSQLDYAFDWLGNQTQWDDDAWSFFERSIGRITNGRETGNRPGALYLSTNIDTTGGVEDTWGGAGWVEVNYGQGGNVSDYTVHGQCQDRVEPSSCHDVTGSLASRISNFQTNCTCATEQHFSLRWDELNRLVEGRRFDRVGGSVGSGTGAWTYAARMRYRYDGANQRTVKESFEATGINTASRVALFIYPGDFERRGLVRNTTTYDAVTTGVDATETQYMVAGARIVWDASTSATLPNLDRNRRVTYALTDLLQTSGAVVDLASGELLELSTYYPNGARENLWASDSNAPLEPMGFTGKEADEEIGLTYFGERWLMPRLGRWVSPDPLHVHASGGGEALNSYHYVSGNLLQARDPLGLCGNPGEPSCGEVGTAMQAPTDRRAPASATEPEPGVVSPHDIPQTHADTVERAAQHSAAEHLLTMPQDAAAMFWGLLTRSPVETLVGAARPIVEAVLDVGGHLAHEFQPGRDVIDLDRLRGDPVEIGTNEGAGRPLAIVASAVIVSLPAPSAPTTPLARAVAQVDEAVAIARAEGRRPATIVGAVSPSTGEIVVAENVGRGGGCAEQVTDAALGSPPDILFTPAIRPGNPRTQLPKVIPPCPNCRVQFGRGAFPLSEVAEGPHEAHITPREGGE